MKNNILKNIVKVMGILAILLTGLMVASRVSSQRQIQPEIVSPTPGSTLQGSSVTFTWSANGNDVQAWTLVIGTSPGKFDLYRSGRLSRTTTTVVVDGLPTNGDVIYVTLGYWLTNRWFYIDYEYKAGLEISEICPCYTIEQLNDLFDEWVGNRGDQIADCNEHDNSSSHGYPPYTYYNLMVCVSELPYCDPYTFSAGIRTSHAKIDGTWYRDIWTAECYILDDVNDEYIFYEANLTRREIEICADLFKSSKWVEGVTCN